MHLLSLESEPPRLSKILFDATDLRIIKFQFGTDTKQQKLQSKEVPEGVSLIVFGL